MPQNFKTHTVHVNQRQYETLREFPVYKANGNDRAFAGSEYQVVDVTLRDGTRLGGLLVVRDKILAPDAVVAFTAEDIAGMASTPRDEIPDFTITDRDALSDAGSIEWGNLLRLYLFGPEEVERDWRSAPLEEAHDEALDDNDRVESYGTDLPANYGPHGLTLTRGGIRMHYTRACDDEGETATIRPKNPDLWADLLEQTFEIDPSFTLGEMIEMLDLPPEVDREVFQRTMSDRRNSFRAWVESSREKGWESDTEIEHIRVGAYARECDDGVYSFCFEASGMGKPLEEGDEMTGLEKGARIPYTLGFGGPARLRNVPLRHAPELVVPMGHERIMEFYRGTHRDWHAGGKAGPEPEIPVLLRTMREISLGEFIRAVFSELASENAHFDGEA